MTATVVKWILDELATVVDGQPDDHPLRRVDRDNNLRYDDGGTFDMEQSMTKLKNDLEDANYVGARFADRDGSYIGTEADRDLDEVVGVRVVGMTARNGEFGHIDPLGEKGVRFQGTDDALVEQIQNVLFEALKWPDAGRTNVTFTDLSITNEAPLSAAWADFYRYDFDVVFNGFEEL
jgi:hypothetical protein